MKKEIKTLAPSEEETPPKGWDDQRPRVNVLEKKKVESEIKSSEYNQKTARALISVLIGFLCLVSMGSLIFSFLKTNLTLFEDVAKTAFTIIQSALFTLLGFLFGERKQNGK